ncbi:uncharacterized protein LOC132789930 [Drosophila nasuta]|uniref:Uncharacterized protein LOC117566866 n=1 Tax=Drosophila albomicans TaxID=7291 RepID=A0A6P8XYR0_DROAB|nr:uncharacterized protein LOC117566866 [Drosophila albomicans]XP_060654259.1 uncharacterized protein LOC132789930 [Drosophila nasuta]
MDATKDQGLVIKLAQKNKETQTVKLGSGNWFGAPHAAGAGYNRMPAYSRISWQFYKDREEELYRRACHLKGIRVRREEEEEDSFGSEEEPIKPHYRYTLDEMKSYNPYRFINLKI